MTPELAAKISRYENGRITPSADVIIRLSEVFDVTTDYLLLDDAPKRPQRTPDEAALGDRIAAVSELGTVVPVLLRSWDRDPPRSLDTFVALGEPALRMALGMLGDVGPIARRLIIRHVGGTS